MGEAVSYSLLFRLSSLARVCGCASSKVAKFLAREGSFPFLRRFARLLNLEAPQLLGSSLFHHYVPPFRLHVAFTSMSGLLCPSFPVAHCVHVDGRFGLSAA